MADKSSNFNDSAKPDLNENIRTLGQKIKGIKIAMLTTVDPDGVLRSRPMATQEAEFDGRIWFFTRNSSGMVHSVEADQHVNLAYSDPSDHRWISVAGRARLVHDKDKMAELWTPALKAWFPEGLEDPEIALLCVDAESAQIWDSPSGALVHLVGFTKAILTGKPYDERGETQKLDIKSSSAQH